jgi:hypothetical protein
MKIFFTIFILFQSVYSQSFIFEKYNPNEKLIDVNILKSLPLDDLRLLRNSIFANYYHQFKSVDLKSIFNLQLENNKHSTIDFQLSDIEQRNLDNILAIEKSFNMKIIKVWRNEIGFSKEIRKINFDKVFNDEIIKLCSNDINYEFNIYALETNQWIKKRTVKIPIKPQSWTIGDLNKNNIDEIYFAKGDSLFIIENHLNHIITKHILLSEKIWQLLAGDINGDSTDELLIFSFKEKYDYHKPQIPLSLKIYQISNYNLQQIWEDNTQIKFSHSNIVPPFELLFISKYFYGDKNHLFIRSEQSDVNPSKYITYFWENDNLNRGSKFYFSDNNLFIDWSKWKEKSPFLIGTLNLINYKNFYFGGTVLDTKDWSWSYTLFSVNNNEVTKRIKLFSMYNPTSQELVVLSGKFWNNNKSIIAISKNWIKMIK